MKNIVFLMAGGVGSRFGADRPKQYLDLNGKPVIDYVIDACDTISAKILIIKECIKRNIKFIVSCGTANKLDPKKLEITTLDKTSYDSLAKKLRYELRKENISNKITVVSSIEECIKSTPVGSYSPVPNTAGILLGDYVIKDIIKQEN